MPPTKVVSLDPITQNNFQVWESINADIERLKAIELQYRAAIIPHVGFSDKPEGSQTVSVDGAMKLELDRPWYYKVKATQDEISAVMTALHAHNEMATIGLLQWKPEISVSKYRDLTDEEKRIIAPILDIKPGVESLKVVSK